MSEGPLAAARPWTPDDAWRSALDAADDSPFAVAWPSHHPDLFDALTGTAGGFDLAMRRVRHLLDAGRSVVLAHPVARATLSDLRDLVRFVDDRLPAVLGLRFTATTGEKPQSLPGFSTHWQAALYECGAREVGFEIGPGLPPAPGASLSPARTPPPPPPHPELLSTMPRPADDARLGDALDALLAPIGTLARYIHRTRLHDPPAELLAYMERDPRDAQRAARQTRETPWVLIQLAVVTGEHGEPTTFDATCLAALLDRCTALDTLPHVAVAHDAMDARARAIVDSLAPLAASRDLPFYAIDPNGAACPDVGANPIRFDACIALTHIRRAPFSGALDQTPSLLPKGDRATLLANAAARLGDEAAPDPGPPSFWLYNLWAPRGTPDLVSPLPGNQTLGLGRALLADIWLADLPDRGLLMASSDPLSLDRAAADLLDLELHSLPLLGPAAQRGVRAAMPEGVMPGGVLPAELVRRPHARWPRSRPLTILGLASTTLQNHTAALVRDGVIVAAVQEERLRRRKQHGWHAPGRPGVTVVSDPTIPLADAWPRRSIAEVLRIAGVTFDDIDFIALNGIPARWFPTYGLTGTERPPVTLRDGRTYLVPHHLTHAASAYRPSGMDEAFVFTVDGRGERETATFFEAGRDRVLRRSFDVLCHEDSLIGGVYEYFTTILGFGHHGQGSTMGLAAMGEAGYDISAFLSARSRDDYSIHDRGIEEAFGHFARGRHEPIRDEHIRLAASVQAALEDTVLRFLEDGLAGRKAKNLCLAGGVALNCQMNQRIRTALGVENIYVQPAAHDAGTAVGAALEVHFELTGENGAPMEHAYLGPSYSDARIAEAIKTFGLVASRPHDLARDVAERIAAGEIVCWFQGKMELGPRALGARSILSDPRSRAVAERVNLLKGREWWRPFGPSILAGRESEWFETPFHTPFMLFTLPVRPERRERIPAVVHADGTSRPQSVVRSTNARYWDVISQFERITGIPMVTNTSFNTAHEPVVCTPEDALASFMDLGADCLAIGDHLVVRRDQRA
ncbi:MAG: carbamoyltransferase C-terminal domain-containing protein [Myxococcota bacterium]